MRKIITCLLISSILYFSGPVLAATDLPIWSPLAVRAAASFLLVITSLLLLNYLWRKYGQNLFKSPAAVHGEEKPPIVDPAKETMDRLAKLLSKIEPNTTDAEARLQDARIATETLIRQVLKVVERVEDLERQANYIGQATEAIQAGRRDDLAYLAGKINDSGLRTLLLSPYLASRTDLKTEAFVLLANERGTLEECAAGYGRLVTALCGQLAQARSRIVGLEQQIEMLEASHPILLIEQGLQESVDALNLRAQPALRWTAKQALPAGVQGYLK
ncbi:MAG: hypothetical protein KJ077_11775 [Anaerolineae bacterium]|nr:hypothetical protein [Anaerolineae bacterium]